MSVLERMHKVFFKSVDASSLAVFRMMFGALLLFEAVNYGIFLCLSCTYRDTSLLFKYHHFEWAVLPPGIGLELLFVVMGISAFCVMIGLFYRVAMITLTLVFSWWFLLDQALYLNHFYLVIIYCVILIFVPAHRHWSFDAKRNPEWASAMVPNWGRWWLIAQTEIVLLYAGFVKLNFDWLNLEPMRLWMNWRSADEAAFFQWITQDWGIAVASYGVIALHLIGAPLLLWRRTRLPVFFVYCFFHITNAFVFNIGIFPFMTIGATLLFFDPDWPRQFLRWLKQKRMTQRLSDDKHVGLNSRLPDWLLKLSNAPKTSHSVFHPSTTSRLIIILGICLWLAVQVAVPLRHWAAPGEVAWNEDGHRFSWRMKLRSKQGSATFAVIRDDGMRWQVDPAEYLTAKQTRKMVCIPDLIWQFAQFLETEYSENGRYEIAVHADAMCSLNTREAAPLVNRLVDLTTVKRSDPVTGWTFPLTKPLPNPIF
ncbi:MAG: HTTM domain-containing protein [Granulosicoccus sp.]|nr:HTTM domain-containing protein [Granulosicoccus sp.]